MDKAKSKTSNHTARQNMFENLDPNTLQQTQWLVLELSWQHGDSAIFKHTFSSTAGLNCSEGRSPFQ